MDSFTHLLQMKTLHFEQYGSVIVSKRPFFPHDAHGIGENEESRVDIVFSHLVKIRESTENPNDRALTLYTSEVTE